MVDDDAIISRFQPIIRFSAGEYFLPMAIDDYLPHCRLWLHRGRRSRTCAAEVGELNRQRLVELTAGMPTGWSLQYATRTASRSQLVSWRMDQDRPRFRGGSRLGSVGVMGRLIDTALRMTLLVRGRVAGGTEATAELQYRTERARTEHTCYTRLFRQDGYLVVQYWFFYAFNDWRSRAHGVNDHEGDWEQVTIFCSERNDVVTPQWVVFSAHDEQGDDLRRRWDDPDITMVGDQVVVFAGLGSHSGAYLAGDYLVTVDRHALGHLYAWGRHISRLLLPWTRSHDLQAVGAPYIDYARGDGECVGEGSRTWRREPIDDSTPWITSYAGLWGNDTEDPFGGERGPAGPRYEKSGVVRRSWAEPVAWAGLDKVPPDDESLDQVLARRRALLDEQLPAERERREHLIGHLRANAATGAPIDGLRRTVDEQQAALEELVEEQRRLELVATIGRSATGPHDHLRHRRLPIEAQPTVRRRLLTAWATISTPLVLLTMAVLVLPLGLSIAGTALVSLVVIFALEALSRRRLVSFVLTTVIVIVAFSLAVAVIAGLLAGWRYTTAILFASGAITVLALNLAELRRQ